MSLEQGKRLRRSRDNRMIAGVCGGLGEYFGIDPTVIRLVFAILVLAGAGMSIPLYAVLWIVMPLARPGEIEVHATRDLPASSASDAAFTQQEVAGWDLEPAGVQPSEGGQTDRSA